jgi:hypothetical protein
MTRNDFATPFNAQAQYEEFLAALDSLQGHYGLQRESHPGNWLELSAFILGRKQAILVSGNMAGRRFTLGAVNAGGSFLTRLELSGDYRLPIDVIVNQPNHVIGLGMDIRFIAGKPLAAGRLAVRPLSQSQSTAVWQSLSPGLLPQLETLIFLQPSVPNLSSQVIQFYEKKFNARQATAYLHDYGLPRDPAYLVDLVARFTQFCVLWETAGLSSG